MNKLYFGLKDTYRITPVPGNRIISASIRKLKRCCLGKKIRKSSSDTQFTLVAHQSDVAYIRYNRVKFLMLQQ